MSVKNKLSPHDLPPLILPLVKLESTEGWPQEQVVGSSKHCAALPGCIPSAILQLVNLLELTLQVVLSFTLMQSNYATLSRISQKFRGVFTKKLNWK